MMMFYVNKSILFSYNCLIGSQITSKIQKEAFHPRPSGIYTTSSALFEAHRPCWIFEVLDFCLKNLHKFVLWQYLTYLCKPKTTQV